jgi:hypothetical protein
VVLEEVKDPIQPYGHRYPPGELPHGNVLVINMENVLSEGVRKQILL